MKNVLVLAGHLDDSIIAIGGILKKFTNAGHKVSVVCFGNGDEAFTKPGDRERCIESFGKEAIEAHSILGIDDFTCFEYPDFGVVADRETYRLCIEAIRRTQPDIIFGHYWREYFQHHAMARLACDSWWQAGWECSADLGRPWAARAMYHFEVVQPLPDPTHIVDITDTFDAKIEAWKKFVTAQEHLAEMIDQLETRARYYGSQIGVKYAETLKQSFYTPQKVADVTEEL